MARPKTRYFEAMRARKDRVSIEDDWIEAVIAHPEKTSVQADGRIRKWAKIPQANDKYLRVVLLEDEETLHNAFFDRGFRP